MGRKQQQATKHSTNLEPPFQNLLDFTKVWETVKTQNKKNPVFVKMGNLCSSGNKTILKYAAVDVSRSEPASGSALAPGTPQTPTQTLSGFKRKGSFKGNMVQDYSTDIMSMYDIESKKILGSGASSEVVRIRHKVTGIK